MERQRAKEAQIAGQKPQYKNVKANRKLLQDVVETERQDDERQVPTGIEEQVGEVDMPMHPFLIDEIQPYNI